MKSIAVLSLATLTVLAFACASSSAPLDHVGGSAGSGGGAAGGSEAGAGGDGIDLEDCLATACSADQQSIVDCEGRVVETCTGTDGCDPVSLTCANGCTIAAEHEKSVGCEYYATKMLTPHINACFAAFVTNLWHAPAHIEVTFRGKKIALETYAKIPSGSGPTLQYEPYDPLAGLPPGEVAILFLAGGGGTGEPTTPCPVPAAMPVTEYPGHLGHGIGSSFHIATDVPVVAYQMNPYGGAASEVADGSLVLPTSAWSTNYVLAHAYGGTAGGGRPSLNIVAAEDDTEVTILPVVDLEGSAKIPAAAAGQPSTFTLQRGEQAQLTQDAELTGSILETSKPVGLMAGHTCSFVPEDLGACDHLEEVIPPIQALGSEYVSVMHRPRDDEYQVVRVIGAVDGTALSWSPEVGGPATLDRGQVAEIQTSEPFVVRSQDADHPFMLMTYMVGAGAVSSNKGDPAMVIGLPPAQFLQRYAFFADPTYPETSLVVVRARDRDGQFADVEVDCAGALSDWTPIDDYEWTRVDLVSSGAAGTCLTGRREMKSDAPFGLWVWGWDDYTSYGYPAGMNVQKITPVTVPIPK